jgi:hypothetical protein
MTLTTVDAGMLNSQSQQTWRNRIINGAMVIDQRNAGASVTMSNAVVFTVDRWWSFEDTDGTMTAQQSSTAPTGFTNSLLCTTTSADASLGATQRVVISQAIEGFNIADLGWGTASAQTVTLSFWVRSSLTGIFGGAIKNASSNRTYPFTYTISSANTWEQKTITIAGDTSGTWLATNGVGMNVNFGLGVGSTYSATAGAWAAGDFNSATGATSVVGTNGATFYITGVQLEKGSTATSFDYRPYGTELALCQRYCEAYNADGGTNYAYFSIGSVQTSTNTRQTFNFKTQKRALPTATTSAANTFILDASPSSFTVSTLALDRTTLNGATLEANPASSTMSSQQCVRMIQNNTSTCFIIFSSEL